MEIWDLYDEDRKLSGKTMIRGDEVPDNLYHLVVHTWIKDANGDFLIGQRAEDRPSCPLMWECSGGSVLQGETSIQGAVREVKEELGIDLKEEDGKLVYTKIRKVVNGSKFNDIMDVWLFEYNGEVNLSKATTAEVRDYKWMKKEEVKEYFDNKKLVQTLGYFFDEIDI